MLRMPLNERSVMSVFVVIWDYYEFGVMAVFSTRELAQAFIDGRSKLGEYKIEEYIVDE